LVIRDVAKNRIEQEVGRAEVLRRQLFDWLAGIEPAPSAEAGEELSRSAATARDR
jgi:hypothetical protein